MLKRTREVERRAEEAQQAALRARLEALQARTNPHFLFNSLNTVASLIVEDPAVAEQTLERLAGLFRYSLEGSRRTSVRLADELTATCDYLDVESLRLGDRLRWNLSVDEDLDNVRLPPLTLQPLVENAVRHGIAPRKEGGIIDITVSRDADTVVLTVKDDGPGKSGVCSGTGTALEDLKRRLEVAYGGAASIHTSCDDDEVGFSVDVRLPWKMTHESVDRR